ncbi:ornithine--oxo-acid transaminase [Caldimonas brevitalea]|uniref:ornithine aminotransferase n=1 Tax=Caldimonas brevitalea TaxID=413882 RepID=A0A0G3BMC2_9BURK|nr:ornithine--oxo-acid transaminase [Caldimonas brevitalea]AKJ27705.1 ornithine--oxo-acid aminotransferase [Caldimonas brevitalea]
MSHTTPVCASGAIALEDRYGAHNYHPLPVVLVRGEGVHLWDEQGRRYLDMMSAYSAVSFGHSRPELVQVLVEQAQRLAITSRAYHTDRLGPFLEKLCQLTGLDRALPMNTGAEAVETAIKAVRKWGYKVKGVAEGQAQIIVPAGNFAGRTTTIVGFSSEAQYRDGFGPFAPGFVQVPYGDIAALEHAITPQTVAFFVEPIQGEAGIIVPPAGYLRAARELCDRHRVLLVCDEVQTGLGRTGRILACHHEGVQPDAVTLGKALGGGLLPVSAFVARADVMAQFTPGDHGSTFGGNPLSAAVGLAALQLLERERLSEQAERQGQYLRERLLALGHPAITDVRGKGLLVGVEIDRRYASARAVCEALMHEGVLSKDTHDTVVRLAPPLVVTAAQIDEAVEALQRALRSVEPERRLAA